MTDGPTDRESCKLDTLLQGVSSQKNHISLIALQTDRLKNGRNYKVNYRVVSPQTKPMI